MKLHLVEDGADIRNTVCVAKIESAVKLVCKIVCIVTRIKARHWLSHVISVVEAWLHEKAITGASRLIWGEKLG